MWLAWLRNWILKFNLNSHIKLVVLTESSSTTDIAVMLGSPLFSLLVSWSHLSFLIYFILVEHKLYSLLEKGYMRGKLFYDWQSRNFLLLLSLFTDNLTGHKIHWKSFYPWYLKGSIPLLVFMLLLRTLATFWFLIFCLNHSLTLWRFSKYFLYSRCSEISQ